MLTKRIIPCLDVKDGRVVKGVNFVGLKDAGDPVELAHKYYLEGADEICFLDITATIEGRGALIEVIKATARQVFVPITVGGGVNAPEDVGELLRAGADKVSINSGAVRNPELIAFSSRQYGVQCIVIAIDVKRTGIKPSGWEVFVKGGRQSTGLDAVAWAEQAQKLGAGEILLTSMDADGTKAGYDLELTAEISKRLHIPVIASGGAGSLLHIVEVFRQTYADAALMASLLHYSELTIPEIKTELSKAGIPIRSTLELESLKAANTQ
ncbi:MAG: imidazole glycerol phosphate synthase subunit HisF [Candidatus Caenarcaniphilales bacterium]|nr:imidazole glycerol phosphate synthase subunit HisF [Candidatus Caenarcaniphilales bacterium]